MRFELVEKKKSGVTLRIHWRLPFGRKINKYGVLAIYINLMENTRLPFGLKIINMGCKK